MSNSPALTYKMDVRYIDYKLVGSKKKASLFLSEDAGFFFMIKHGETGSKGTSLTWRKGGGFSLFQRLNYCINKFEQLQKGLVAASHPRLYKQAVMSLLCRNPREQLNSCASHVLGPFPLNLCTRYLQTRSPVFAE